MNCKGCKWIGAERVCIECRKQNNDSAAIQASNVEQDLQHALAREKPACSIPSPCRINVHSRRRKLADVDGVSIKACLDGIRQTGLLVDDGPKFVKEVSFSQEAGSEDETTITITW